MQRKKLFTQKKNRVLPERFTRSEAVLEHLRDKLIFDSEVTEVLDFGCGSGYLSFLLAPYVRRITAVDNSAAMINELQGQLTLSRLKNIRALCLDLTTVENELVNARFDLIISVMVLHHLTDVQKILLGLKSLLKPEGILCIVDLDSENGTFHPQNISVAHQGFARENFTQLLNELGYFAVTIDNAYTIIKVSGDNNTNQYPLFIALADNGIGEKNYANE